MSASHVDELMELWALSLQKHGELGPFSSYENMYAIIDSTEFGDVPWKCFAMSYSGEIQPNDASWKSQEYDVWFRDPDVVIQRMLENPDFHGQFDYAPYIDLDKSGKRRWNDFMTGNYAWRHSVS